MAAPAAVIAQRRRSGHGVSKRAVEYLEQQANAPRPSWWFSSGGDGEGFKLLNELSKAQRHSVVRFQAIWRGNRARNYARKMFRSKVMVSRVALNDTLLDVQRLHAGWRTFCGHMALLFMIIATVYVQLLRYGPDGHDVEAALDNAFRNVFLEDGRDFTSVRTMKDVNDYVRATVRSMYSPDPMLRDRVPLCPDRTCEEIVIDHLEDDGLIHEVNEGRNQTVCEGVSEYSGYADQFSRHQFGLVVNQRRRKMQRCNANTHDLYSETAKSYVEEFPELKCSRPGGAQQKEEYDSVMRRLKPEIFEGITAMHAGSPLSYSEVTDGFYILLDLGIINQGAEQSLCYWEHLESVQWLDRQTESVCLTLMVHNMNGIGRYGVGTLCFNFHEGGETVPIFQVQSGQLLLADVQVLVVVVTGVYLAFAVFSSVLFTIRMARYFGHCSSGNKPGKTLRNWFWSGRAKIDIFELVTLVMHLFVTIAYLFVLSHSDRRVIFKSSEAGHLVEGLGAIKDLVEQYRAIRLIYGVLLVLMTVRSITLLDFHPDTAIISGTVHRAATDLLSFFFVYSVIVVSYALVGLLLFSSDGTAFSTMGHSVVTLLFVSMGEFEKAVEVIYSPHRADRATLANAYLWSFIFLTTLILFNVLLSIVVESFLSLQQLKRDRRVIPFLQSLLIFLTSSAYDVRNFYLPHAKQLLLACCFCRCLRRRRGLSSDDVAGDDAGTTSAAEDAEGGTKVDMSAIAHEPGTSFYAEDVTFTDFEFLDGPHRFVDRLKALRRYAKDEVPTFVVRRELAAVFPSHLVDRLLFLLRERTSDRRPVQVLQEIEMLFGGPRSQLYTIYTIRKLLHTIEERNVADRAWLASQLDSMLSKIAPEDRTSVPAAHPKVDERPPTEVGSEASESASEANGTAGSASSPKAT